MESALTFHPLKRFYRTAIFGNEYFIHMYDVRLLVFTTDGEFVEEATMVRVTPANDGHYHHYELTGTLNKVDVSTNGTDYKLVVLCNMNGACYATAPQATEGTTLADFYGGLTYTFIPTDFAKRIAGPENYERIPMWGVRTVSITDGMTAEIDVLRAMAKVEVSAAEGINLTGVSLHRYNGKGTLVPGDAASKDNTPTDMKGLIINPVSNALGNSDKGLSFHPYKAENGNTKYIIYIPEYKNTGEGATPSNMKVTIGEENYKLEFKDYDTEEPFDIVRNHYYKFHITKVINEVELTLWYQVMDWTEIDNGNLTFGKGDGDAKNQIVGGMQDER